MLRSLVIRALCVAYAIAVPTHDARNFEQSYVQKVSNLSIDVDYAVYEGYHNSTSGLNIWKGYVNLPDGLSGILALERLVNRNAFRIRYAAAPISSLRWKAPQTPATSRQAQNATAFGPNCPQAYPAVPNAPMIPGEIVGVIYHRARR